MLNRIKWRIYISVVIATLIVLAYFYNFHSGFSKVQNDWGSFGSYVGGTLGATFAFLAFLAGLENLKLIKEQQEKEHIFMSIKSYENDLKYCYSLIVSCDYPWIFDSTVNIKELPLRTLLTSDSVDWEAHLKELRDSPDFTKQTNSELFQNSDIWLMAYNAAQGLFKFIELYENLSGDPLIALYYHDTYDIPYNRLNSTSQ
jgi:hypothetical protein